MKDILKTFSEDCATPSSLCNKHDNSLCNKKNKVKKYNNCTKHLYFLFEIVKHFCRKSVVSDIFGNFQVNTLYNK